MWGLALADFGRVPLSSDSLRGVQKRKKCSQNYFQVLQLQAVIFRNDYKCRKLPLSPYGMSSFPFYR